MPAKNRWHGRLGRAPKGIDLITARAQGKWQEEYKLGILLRKICVYDF